MAEIIFGIVIALIIVHEVFEMVASRLNDKARFLPVPENVESVYDKETYDKWIQYSSEKSRLQMIVGGISFLFVVLMLVFGGFRALAEWTMESGNLYLETLYFIGILFLIGFIYKLPFKYYNTFSIEARYGFNRSTKQTFVTDQIKALLMTILFGGGIVYLLAAIYLNSGAWFLPIAFLALMAIFLFINMTYTTIWVPLFNTLTPLEDGDLKKRIEDFAATQNYEIKKIHVMNASKRSSKLNAFFSGFGKFKNVVLFDTLLDKMNDDEVLGVLAHEIGHAKHKDVVRNIFFSMITLGIFLGLFYGFVEVDVFHEAFGLDRVHFGFMLFVFMILLGPVNTLIGIVSNGLSRKAEFKADAFAANNTDKAAMQSALIILSRENFSQLTPHPLFVFLYYSHPPVSQRIEAIEAL